MVLDSDDKLVVITRNSVILIDIRLLDLNTLDNQVILFTSPYFPGGNGGQTLYSIKLDYDQNIGALLITDTTYSLNLYNIRSRIKDVDIVQ